MNSRIGKLLIILCAVILVVGVGIWLKGNLSIDNHKVVTATTKSNIVVPAKKLKVKIEVPKDTEATILTVDEKVDKLIKDMTLEEKVGQIMMVGFQGPTQSDEIKTLIKEKKIGGVILYDRNMISPTQVTSLTKSLQHTALQNRSSLPLMIAIDQEGGDIVRMREKVSPIPSQQILGQTATAQKVYETAKRTGLELKVMGINTNFAPVLDLSAINSRSFSSNPEKVYQFGTQVINGLHDSDITAALKHFPGNGRSNIDPHKETSSVTANQLDLENSDIYPFKQIIKSVDNNKFLVMVTHIKYPAYDREKPASLSPIIIQDLLRKKLGYTGVVVTDDLEMGAVSKYYTYKDIGIEALKAGADLLLVCHVYERQLEVY